MILHHLTVSGLRCLRDPVVLTELSEGVNIIQGPNESGKSTLVLGLVLAFLNRYDVRGQDVAALRPWGTSLSPSMTVEFTANGKRYRLEKRFLDGASSVLSEWNGRAFSRTAEGKAADEMVRRMVDAQFPTRGLTTARGGADGGKLGLSGLAHLLWMPQDADRFLAPALGSGVEDRFRAALGVSLLTKRDDALIARIDEMYARTFTEKRGEFQTGSDVLRAETELKALRARLAEARGALDEATQAVDKLRAAEARHRELVENLEAMKKRARELNAEAERVRALKAQLDKARVEEEMAAKDLERVQGEQQQVARLKRDAAADAESIRAAEAALGEHRKALEGVLGRVGPKRKALVKVREALGAARARLQAAYELDRAKTCLARVTDLEKRIANVRELGREMRELQETLAGRPQPQPADVQAASNLEGRVRAAEAQARAAGLKLTFLPYRELDVTVVSHGPEGSRAETHSVRPDAPLVVDALDRLSLDIPGVGKLEVVSGSGDLKRLLQEAAGNRQKLAEIFERFGVRDLDELRQGLERARQQRDKLETLRARMRELLGAHGGPEDTAVKALEAELERERQALDIQLAALGKTRAELEALGHPSPAEGQGQPPGDGGALDLAPLGRKVSELEAREAKLGKAVEELAREEARLTQEMAAANVRIASLRQAQQKASDELASRLARFGEDEAGLASAVAEARAAWQVKTEQVERLKALMPEDPGQFERDAHKLEQDIEQTERHRIPEFREQMGGLRQQLERAGNEGLYSKLASLEEEVQLAEAEYERALRRAQAVRVLYHMAHSRKESLLSAFAVPVRDEVTRMFAEITESPGRRARLAANLSLVGFEVGPGNLAPVDAFSVGAQEQLMMVMRLALGRFLSRLERQLVVLDDPLVNTDPERNARVLRLLAAAAETLQLLILTCHPDRYESLPARRFDLHAPER